MIPRCHGLGNGAVASPSKDARIGAVPPASHTPRCSVSSNSAADSPLPQIAALGLIMAGLGLVGMTAGDLPGIAQELAAPRWLMGAIGGVLVGSGLPARSTTAGATRWPSRWAVLVALGVLGIVLSRLSDLTRGDFGHGAELAVGSAVNSAARVLFGIGIGIVLGWAAYERSGSRHRAR